MKIMDIHNGYDFDAYDEQEFRKAFYKGTDAAWKTYERNMKKAHERLEAEYMKEVNRLINMV